MMKLLTLGETIDELVKTYARVAHVTEEEAVEGIISHLIKYQTEDK